MLLDDFALHLSYTSSEDTVGADTSAVFLGTLWWLHGARVVSLIYSVERCRGLCYYQTKKRRGRLGNAAANPDRLFAEPWRYGERKELSEQI